MTDAKNRKETHDLLITVDQKEIEEAQDYQSADDLAKDEVYKSQHSDGHTFNPRRAQVEGLTYTPPTDPPVIGGDGPQGAEIAAGYSLSQEDSSAGAERLPGRVKNNDLDLRDKVYQALRKNSETGHLSQVKVQVQDGTVNLLGTVVSQDDIGIVHEIVAQLKGVVAIKNNLQVKESTTNSVNNQPAKPNVAEYQNASDTRQIYKPRSNSPDDTVNEDDVVDESAWESFPASDAPSW